MHLGITKLIFYAAVLVPISVSGIAQAGSGHTTSLVYEGTFSGSFDPPTLAHLSIIRDAIHSLHLKKLHIFVNVDGPKNYKASVDERIGMLRAGLSDILGSIEFHSLTRQQKDPYVDRLLARKSCVLYRVIGEDSYVGLPGHAQVASKHAPRIVFLRPDTDIEHLSAKPPFTEYRVLPEISGISSSRVRQDLEAQANSSLLDPRVADYIRRNHLYPSYGAEEVKHLQKAHDRAFRSFVAELKARYPSQDLSEIPLPPFESSQSRAAETEEFTRWVISETSSAPGDLEFASFLSSQSRLHCIGSQLRDFR